jgi:hypothetical protein
VDFSTSPVVVDPWPGQGSLAAALRRSGLSVHSPASRLVSATLQPGYYSRLEHQLGPLHAVFFTALPALLDLALPLAAAYATHGVFARVPARYLFSPSASRREWLRGLQDQGRLLVLSGTPDLHARHRCLWLCIFSMREVRDHLLVPRHDSSASTPSLLLFT